MKVDKLLSLIPEEILTQLALETNVDRYSKKLQGEVIFKLMLHCIISHKNNSLRTMESAYESMVFQLLNQKHQRNGIRFSSISERLSSIEVSYFEKLFQSCVTSYKNIIGKETDNIIRFDSTIVSLSTNLIKIGYQLNGGSAQVKQLKFTVGYTDIPEVVHFYHDRAYTSENTALKKTIIENIDLHDNAVIRVFDRGITARKTYDELTNKSLSFVSRISANAIAEEVSLNADISAEKPIYTASLKIVSDRWCYLFSANKKSKHPVRCIEAYRINNNEKLVFVSNIADLTSTEITEIYKRRWDIEVFFKFIKQLLNFSHLVNRSENGVQVMLYVTMIAAILLEAYKKQHKLSGYKIPRQKLAEELEKEITKHIIVLCGGNPDKLDDLLSNKSP